MSRVLALAIALAAASAAPARANPVDAFGFGARSAAMGNAATAAARDASAHYFNPALLALATDIRLDIGYQFADPRLEVNGEDLGVDSSRGLNAGLTVPGRIAGMRVAFGGALFVPDDRVSRIRTLSSQQPRWQLYDNRPQRLFLAANAAIAINDRLSVGGGIAYMSSTQGAVLLVGRVGFPNADDSDLILDIDVDLKTIRYGQFGAQWRPNDWLQVGIAARTGFKVILDQTFEIRGDVGTAGQDPVVDDGFLVLHTRAEDLFQPTQVTAGLAAQLTRRWLLAFDAAYHRWSRFTNPAARITLDYDLGDFNELVVIPNAPELADPNFHDILIPRIGVEFAAVDDPHRRIDLRAGYAYEPSPAPEQVGETNYIDNTKHTVSIGAGLTLRDFSSILRLPAAFDAYVALTQLEGRTNRKLSPADAIGDYSSGGRVLQLGVSSRWRF
jgi:long-subunit fatty acid transport protein